jgi:hypothetical protein
MESIKMTNLMVTIHNTETNEIIEREMTAQEFAAYTAEENAEMARVAAIAKAATDKAALLTKMGLTADEAKLLLS